MRTVGLAAVIIALGFLGITFYYPLFTVIRDGISMGGGGILSPIITAIRDPYFIHLLTFSVKEAILSTLLSLGIGLPGAFILARYEFPGRRLVQSLTVVPFVLPAITVALGFILFFGNNGTLNRLLMWALHLHHPPLRLLYSLTGIVLAHAFYNAPIVMRGVGAAWAGIDPSFHEAAASLGAGRWRRAFGITAPLLAPAILSSSALVFIFTFLSFPIVLTLGGARYATIEVGIYTLIQTLGDIRLGTALIIVETGISLIFSYIYLKAEGRFAVRTQGERVGTRVALFSHHVSIGIVLIYVYIVGILILFLGPIGNIIIDSVRNGARFTIAWYTRLLSLGYNPFLGTSPLGTIGTSLMVACMATALALPIGGLVAWLATKTRIPGRRVLETVFMAPLAVSSIAVGYAIMRGLSTPPLRVSGTIFAIGIAHAVLIYPLVARMLRPVLEGVDPHLVDAARSLGASRGRVFFDVELPLISRGVLAAAVFAFAMSMGEMSATIMLMRPGLATVPIAVYSLIAARQFGPASAMASILIVVTGLAFIIIDRVGTEIKGA